jgi:hypothetical protein
MRSAHVLVRLYPAVVRERWGEELEQQLTESGPRSWPNTIRGAAGLWVRPALWPHTTAGRNCRTLSTLAFAVIVLTTLLLRATGGQALAVGPHDPSRSAWLVLVLLGLLAAAPAPRPCVAALARVALVCVRTLGPPVLALLAMLVAANSGLVSHLTGLPNALLVTYYWATLIFAGARVCALITRLAGDTSAPSVRRLRVAFTLIGSGLALAVCQLMAAMARTQADVTDLITAVALIVFVVVIAAAARDLRAVAC